jgi:tetratricopeptide (TPR) repeat protein
MHFEEWELLAFLDGEVELVDAEAIRAHLQSCAECTGTVKGLGEISLLLRDPLVHQEPSVGFHRLVSEFLQDDGSADAAMANLVSRPVDTWSSVIVRNPAWVSESFCRLLIEAARSHYERDANRALAITDAARTAADLLQSPQSVASLRATVAKERANALRLLGRYDEALAELDWAERFLAHVPVSDFDLAFVNWTRAGVLLHMTRFEEALKAAGDAIRTFTDFGDHHRAAQVQIIEAGLYYEQGDVQRALESYQQLAVHFESSGDELTLARLQANLAACEMSLDDGVAARDHAEKAIRIFALLGNTSEELRVRWTLATSMLREDRLDEALESLQIVHRGFKKIGMQGEAAETLLELVEIHVRREEWDFALTLARAAVEAFRQMNAPVHVADAVAWLERAVQSTNATGTLVTYVLNHVRNTTAREFTPPSFTN